MSQDTKIPGGEYTVVHIFLMNFSLELAKGKANHLCCFLVTFNLKPKQTFQNTLMCLTWMKVSNCHGVGCLYEMFVFMAFKVNLAKIVLI